jgi:hypothetical protein
VTNIGCGTYFVFASFTTLSIVFVYFCVPEPRALSLEEIDVIFVNNQCNAFGLSTNIGGVLQID